MLKKIFSLLFLWIVFSTSAEALTCNSKNNGNWNTAGTWTCGRVPNSMDDVFILSPHNIVMNVAGLVAQSLTINSGAILSDAAGNDLAISGNFTNNGTFTSNNSGVVALSGNASILSGNGLFDNKARLYFSGNTPSVDSAANLNFNGTTSIRVGRNVAGTVTPNTVLTINGTLNGTNQTGGTGSVFIRLYSNNTIVSSTGSIVAPTATVDYRTAGISLTNNGTMTLGNLTETSGAGTFTNGINSNLTINNSLAITTINASANGNTVSYISPATPATVVNNTYYNLGGAGVSCPHSFTISGVNPCANSGTVGSVTLSPAGCVQDNTTGTTSWFNLNNAQLLDGLYASSTGTNGSATGYLKCTGYGFNIPGNATITGVTAKIDAWAAKTWNDTFVRLVKNVGNVAQVQTVSNRSTGATLPRSDSMTYVIYGSATDLWGLTLTPADINDPNFGLAYSISHGVFNKIDTVFVNHMTLKVDYTTPPVSRVDHVELRYTGNAITCQPVTLSIVACGNATCSTLSTSGVTGIINATGGTVNYPNGSGYVIPSGQSSVDIQAWVTQAGVPAVFSATGGTNASTCNVNGIGNCSLTASDSGFLVNAPNHYSGTNQNLTVQAVKKADNSSSCVSAFSGVKPLSVNCTYNNPATGTVNLNLDTLNLACNGVNSNYSANFISGTATIPFSYIDSGKVNISFSHAGSASSSGLAMSGSTSFIASPTTLLITPIAGKKIAGKGFSQTVKALNSNGNITPNFGKEGENINLAYTLTAPTGFVSSILNYSPFSFLNGQGTTAISFSEVGTGTLTATLASGNYLGSGLSLTSSNSVLSFIPDYFEVVMSEGCTGCGYTYSGQNFNTTITAKSALGTTTLNYKGVNACNLVLSPYDNTNATLISTILLNNANILSSDFNNGIAVNSNILTFQSGTVNSPVTIRLRAIEQGCDNVTSQVLNSNNATLNNSGASVFKQGVVRIKNSVGSELLPQQVSISILVWNGTGLEVATTDNITTVSPLITCKTGNLAGLNITPILKNTNMFKGLNTIQVPAPHATGYICLSNSTPSFLGSTVARVTFGVYKGRKEIVYFRERY